MQSFEVSIEKIVETVRATKAAAAKYKYVFVLGCGNSSGERGVCVLIISPSNSLEVNSAVIHSKI